jgi:hypothetical protein
LGFYFLAEVFVGAIGQLFVFAFKPLKFNYSVKRKNNRLRVCRTKTVTENKTEGLA